MDAPGNLADAADREIAMTRVFDAPRELVWKAWTDPAHVTRWWGPRGFTTTTHKMDVRPGGTWRFVMHGPDGRDYQNLITYLEVVEPARLTYKHGGDMDCEPVNFQVTVTFDEDGAAGERTRINMRMVFPSKNARDFVVREYGAIEGGKQTLARLDEHLSGISAGCASPSSPANHRFVVTRVFAAPRELVWRVWTQGEHLKQWFGPKGITIPSCTIDLRPGGVFHFGMQWPDGNVLWGRWVFREIVPMERLVYVNSFSDERGGLTRAPFDGDWPLEMLSTITFAEHAGIGGGTTVVVEWSPLNATESEQRTFADGHDSMRQGWGGTLDKLTAYLSGAVAP